MDENWKKQRMPLIVAPTHLHNGFNKKGRKTNETIGDKGVKKETPVYRDCMDMRDRVNVVTGYPKEDIIKLSPNTSVRTPSDRSSTKDIYNIINTRKPRVWISR